MKLEERLGAFDKLGDVIASLSTSDRKELAEKAGNENPWFTENNIQLALHGVNQLLRKDLLVPWAMSYALEPAASKKVGVAMAGNIPLVGFHDFLCTLVSGHQLLAKPSSQDSVMIRFMAEKLVAIQPHFSERISFVDKLNDSEAVIATGSDNTARYFEYYFRHLPHILRKNRTSCAVLQGNEPPEELASLGRDVFSYFGLGCRNVSKLYLPKGFELETLKENWTPFQQMINHHKYANNYHYQKAIASVNGESHHDTGFILLKETSALVSPVAVLYFERYSTMDELNEKLESSRDKLQAVMSARAWYPESIPFGFAQLPVVTDYADGVDTMKFLAGLK